MSNVWKFVSLLTLAAVVVTAGLVMWDREQVASAQAVQSGVKTSVQGLGASTGMGERGITVNAQGQVKAKPDVAYVSLGVRTTAPTAKEAMDANSTAIAAMIAKIESLGVPKKDMQTGNISLYPQTKPITKEETQAEQIIGYWASNSLNVTVSNLAKLGEILDASIAAGANSVSGIRFGIRDDSALRDQALVEAVKTARAKADLVAGELGLKVTGVESVSLESYGSPVGGYVEMAAPMMRAASDVPVEAGELTVSASVRVVFSF